EQARHLSRNKLRGWCEERFLSYLRMREWHELHGQLKGALTEMELRENDKPAEPAAIHRALIAGFAAHAGNRTEKGDFLGAHGRRFHVHPGSGMAKKPPRWLLAAEVVETTRVYARMCAKIEPEWIESAVPHLLRHHHFEPHFEERAGTVAAFDRVSLFGLVVQPRRRVNYGRIDAADARRIFIREGLVEGRLRTRGEFLSHNRALVAEVEALEAKGRRRDLLVDEETLFAFYDARLPAEIHDGAGFERWRKRAEREDAKALLFTREALMQQDAAHLGAERFPDRLEWNGLRLPLAYRFEPGAEDDGVSVSVPAAALNGLDAARAEWLVPGLLEERVAALIRSLPKGLRKHFVPAPDFARAALARIEPGQGSLLDALADVLRQMTGVEVPRESWNEAALEAHLRLRLRVLDEEGREIAAGRDLQSLKDELSGRAERSFEQTRPQGFEREGITDWDFGELPEHVDFERHGIGLRGWPALDDRGDTVALVLCDAPAAAAHTHRAGLRRLFMLRLREPVKYLQRHLPGIQSMCLQYASVDRCETLKEDLIFAAVERAAMQAPWPRERETFDARCDEAAARVVAEANDLCALAARILERHHAVRARLKGSLPLSWIEAAADMRDQLDHLVYPHFLLDVPAEWLAQFPRWLDAVERRMQRLDREPDKDRRLRVDLLPLWEDAKARLVRTGDNTQVQRYRWLIEELRVSLFAQELGTVEKVSVRRLEDLRRALG
ncbi:MAG: ATP-dependent RNA helicase HrpA, partial [Chromatiales bacterium]|nr:ATP-dependent RNA helicase HrpA [Chromatiales bacterium]